MVKIYDAVYLIGLHVNGLVQDCCISIADALKIPQSCTKSSV